MNRVRPIIAALFVGWVSGAGSWYVITKAPDAAGERGQHDALSAGPDSPAGEAGEERLAVFPPPAETGNSRDVSVRAVLPPVVDDMPVDMPMLPVAAGNPADDGVVQDTGEFIDADDPEAYVAYLNARSDGDTVQDTGEFLDVGNPLAYVGDDSSPRLPQDTGEFIDVDDPQAYAAYWDRQSDGVVHDTGEFVAVDAWQAP
ncbi:MAG TPA: hypothetical protein ENK51_03000 [Gammaproteobacteria bacterium]|nr:hypothetical protein [Gammaproteobacteria bacterium]